MGECCNRQGPHVHAVPPKPVIVDDLPVEDAPSMEQIAEDIETVQHLIDVLVDTDEEVDVPTAPEPKVPYNDAKGPPENAPEVTKLLRVTEEELRSAPQVDRYDESNQPSMDLETGVITGAPNAKVEE